MPSGIRATVAFTAPDVCPIAEVSAAAGATVDSVATSVRPPGTPGSTTEFALDASADFDPDADVDAALTRVFSHGSTDRYRLAHGDADCPCTCLGRLGCPVVRYVAREGRLRIVFHAADYEELRFVVGELRDRFPAVDIERFVRSPVGDGSRDGVRVLVDRGKLTARQLEVLETAHGMGYFERPRRSNATEIAAELGINPSTFREHLAAAEAKILDDVL